MRLVVLLISLFMATPALAGPTLDDLKFLEGSWRGGDEFVFEETWTVPAGGVMTAMARGVASGALRVLEYIVVSEEDGAVIMRFKHFNADFSSWEDNEPPVTLTLTAANGTDVTFTADLPSHTVTSIRYWMPDADTLQADITQIENGEEGGFSLVFKRMD